MLKILIAHNRYQSALPSGENRIVDSEVSLLREAGVEVIEFIEDSDELERSKAALASAALGPIASPRGVSRLHRLFDEHQPDVLHLHNVFPLISPWTIRTAERSSVPVVQTVHNYRHTCVAGMHLRESRICEDCRLHKFSWPAIQHACYRGSRTQSAVMAIGQLAHRPTWRLVDRFLVASPHMEERLVSTGIPKERIEWRPTFAEDVGCEPLPDQGPVVFVGRLEHAKGIELLLEAWTPEVARRWGKLVVAGDGPLRPLVEARVANDSSVEWRGSLDGPAVRSLMKESRLIALPSLWFEGFPRVAAEAMSVGRPLLVWEGAGFSRVAGAGAGWALSEDATEWAARLLTITDSELRTTARGARQFYESHCSPQVAVDQLVRNYTSVVQGRHPG